MSNPLEQAPVFLSGKAQKQDICQHGKPKDSCGVCNGLKESVEEEKEKKKEKISYENPEHIQELISHPQEPIDLKTCSLIKFKKMQFGVDSKFISLSGYSLLRNFGTKNNNTENMIALLNFAGIEREQFNPENFDHIREMLDHPKEPIDLETCGVTEFRKMQFGVGSKFSLKGGNWLLENFGAKNLKTENMIALLNFAGIEREQFNPENSDHIREMLDHLKEPIDLKTCGVTEFREMQFGVDSKFPPRSGARLLLNFGTKSESAENIIALLNFAGIEREQFNPENFDHIREMLDHPKEPIDLATCNSDEFKKMQFGVDSKFPPIGGNWLLENFGAKNLKTENMIALLNFAGIEREWKKYEQFNPENSDHIREMLDHPKEPINLETCGVTEFRKMQFGVGSKFSLKGGNWLLENFGTKNNNTENMIALLNFIGIEREKEEPSNEEQKNLKQYLEKSVQEIADPENQDERAQKIREIMQLLPENACDVLLKYHPEYKGLKVEYVKKIIADYLGDFLLARRMWKPKDIEMTKELFSEERFQKTVYLKMKEASLDFFQKEKKSNPELSDQDLINKYFADEELLRVATEILEVQKAVEDLQDYYKNIFEMASKKPDNLVSSLKEGRVFPDINQLINIKEISDNGRMMIADEMGLGKSASAIITKEYLSLKCGLVVAPNNVISTWEKYLSSAKDENGKQVGYFKAGLEPKVLVVKSLEDIQKLDQPYDYILISQEKLNDRYVNSLEKIDFDMMIVDEVHKMKNIEAGVRSENIIKLSKKIQGPDKYLAMLSGTPMPNKVKDLAIVLKLLDPEKYEKISDKDLVNRIIYGDLVDLREELFSRMQMKKLSDSIEMPPLFEEDIKIELSPEEKEVYQILLEEDELTASEKIIIFRQFLMNPQLLSVEPGFEGSKIKKLKNTLGEDLKSKNRVVVFVNSYIDGVIRPKIDDQNGKILTDDIINKLELPADIKWKSIHGKDNNKEEYRKETQKEFNDTNEEKIVLFVSGNTADVGVDFSGADEVIFYNEPWSNYEKKQQMGRSYREGLKNPLTVKTLITEGTIEEGIRRYANAKEKAIEKLLRGLGRTEAENILLEKDSKNRRDDVETNEELSREYMSDWEKLMLHFGEAREAGVKWFENMPEDKKISYAELYRKLGGLTYQGNNARVSASLIAHMMKESSQKNEKMRIIDIASGPEMLKRHSTEELVGRVYSLDINEKHFDDALDKRRTFKSSYLDLHVRSDSVDYYNIGFAFHQTKPIKFYKKNYERLQVLAEMNRVLKPGGKAILSEVHNIEFNDFNKFKEVIEKLGFKLIKKYSGEVNGGENYHSHFIVLEKINEIDGYESSKVKFDNPNKQELVNNLGEKLGKDLLLGLQMTTTSKGKSHLKDQRRMIEKFNLEGKEMEILFNQEDRKLFDEEQKAIKDGEELKQKYERIENIPMEKIIEAGFERRVKTPGYCLLYKMIENGGAVIIRDNKNKKESNI